MKKLLMLVLLVLSFPVTVFALENNYVSEDLEKSLKSEGISYELEDYSYSDDKVNVYLFRGQRCGHCREFLSFVNDTLVKEYGNYFNFVGYEVWKNSDNNDLKNEVMDKLNITSRGVPLIVIGDRFFVGYGSGRNQNIIDAVMYSYNSSDKVDVVDEIINGKKEIHIDREEIDDSLDKATITKGTKVDNKENVKEICLMVFVVVVVLSISFVLFMMFGPKKKRK